MKCKYILKSSTEFVCGSCTQTLVDSLKKIQEITIDTKVIGIVKETLKIIKD